MKKWAYKIVGIQSLHRAESLNQFGQEGWELFAVDQFGGYLKREIPEPPTPPELPIMTAEEVANDPRI